MSILPLKSTAHPHYNTHMNYALTASHLSLYTETHAPGCGKCGFPAVVDFQLLVASTILADVD